MRTVPASATWRHPTPHPPYDAATRQLARLTGRAARQIVPLYVSIGAGIYLVTHYSVMQLTGHTDMKCAAATPRTHTRTRLHAEWHRQRNGTAGGTLHSQY